MERIRDQNSDQEDENISIGSYQDLEEEEKDDQIENKMLEYQIKSHESTLNE